MRLFKRSLTITFFFVIELLSLSRSTTPFIDAMEKIRVYTRNVEFDYVTWTSNAIGIKLGQSTLALDHYLTGEQENSIVQEYRLLVQRIDELTHAVELIYSDPGIDDAAASSHNLRIELSQRKERLSRIKPAAEAILQKQITSTLRQVGLSFLGQPFPPVSYHTTPLPYALIISPRNVIRQDANISLREDLTLEEIIQLEEAVSANLEFSAVIEEVGGVGTYPTMVMQTSDLPWLLEVIAHEWIHNYLTLYPLGILYDSSPEIRTMNETTASIAGKEIGEYSLSTYYPDMVIVPSLPPLEQPINPEEETLSEIPIFDFRAEMHETRVKVDEMLSQGSIAEAEKYMEERRVFLWENGYQIRKLNQAYFAFHGAYADVPGGAAGADPVGPAVRLLRSRAGSLAEFLTIISTMTSFEELQRYLERTH